MDSNGQSADSTVQDIALHFGVSTKTVRRWVKGTDIPHRRIGGVIRFNLQEVDRWSTGTPKDGHGDQPLGNDHAPTVIAPPRKVI
jgi:excisionase family DNA binding protein